MNVLLLGAEGLLGSCLMQALAQKKWNLLGVGRSTLDVANYVEVESLLGKSKPDIIINAAAYTAVERAEADALAADSVNHLAVKNLARIAKRLNAVLIHFSTDYVFDGEQSDPYLESDAARPLNTYGKTKRAGELAIIEEAEKYFIIRTSWLFGEGGNNFFGKMLGLLQSSRELDIVDDQIGGPTYVRDLAAVVEAVLNRCYGSEALPWGIYHYSGYPFVSWYEFALAIQAAQSAPHNCLLRPITSDAYPSMVVRPLNSRLNSCRLENWLGVRPSDWRAAVSSLIVLRGI